MADSQPVTSTTPSGVPQTSVPTTTSVPTIPQDELIAMQKRLNLTEQEAKERVRYIKFDIPIIPLPAEQQKPVAEFQNTPDSALKPTTEMAQQVKNATLPLALRDSNDTGTIIGSGTIVGINNDRTKVLLSTGIHSFLNMLDINPNEVSSEDMIARAKKKINERLGQSFSSSTDKDTLRVPLKDRNGNVINVVDAKFVAVNGPDGSEQILVEVTLAKPLDQSFAPLAVQSTQSAIQQNSRILTGGYTPDGTYQESLTGRVFSPTLQNGIANDPLKDPSTGATIDPKSDDKKYNDIFLVTNVPGIQRGTSGGTVATIRTVNGKEQVVLIGTITAKTSENVGWVTALNDDFVNRINSWNSAN